MFGKSVTSLEDITPKNKNWFFLLILTLMSMAGLIGSDLYLPVLPEMGLSLHKDTVAMQVTLGIYLFGLSFWSTYFRSVDGSLWSEEIVSIRNDDLFFCILVMCIFLFLLSNTYFKIISSFWSLFRARDWKSYDR